MMIYFLMMAVFLIKRYGCHANKLKPKLTLDKHSAATSPETREVLFQYYSTVSTEMCQEHARTSVHRVHRNIHSYLFTGPQKTIRMSDYKNIPLKVFAWAEDTAILKVETTSCCIAV